MEMYTMGDMKCYLAGYIQGSKLDECLEWRKRIRDHYESYKGKRYPIDWLDPLNGQEMATISQDGLRSSVPANSIIHRDYTSVMKSDIIVVNMDTFGESRPLIGTICELAWAWEHHKPIVMITDEDKYKYHPFISYFASWIVKDVDELLEKKVINYFYKGWNNAIY